MYGGSRFSKYKTQYRLLFRFYSGCVQVWLRVANWFIERVKFSRRHFKCTDRGSTAGLIFYIIVYTSEMWRIRGTRTIWEKLKYSLYLKVSKLCQKMSQIVRVPQIRHLWYAWYNAVFSEKIISGYWKASQAHSTSSAQNCYRTEPVQFSAIFVHECARSSRVCIIVMMRLVRIRSSAL